VTSTASCGKPSVHHSRREEVQPGITTTVGLHQLPTLTTSAATISKLEVRVQWNSRDASYHLEQFNEVCSAPSFLQSPQFQLPKSFIVIQVFQIIKEPCETVLDSL